MRRTNLYFFLQIALFLTASCSNKPVTLSLQNTTVDNPLQVIVRINDKDVFNGPVKKAITNASFISSIITIPDDSFNIEVSIPSDSLSDKIVCKSKNVRRILINLNTDPLTLVPLIKGGRDTIITKKKVSINFISEENKEFAL